MSIENSSLVITGASSSLRKEEALKIAKEVSSQVDTYLIDTQENKGISLVKEVLSKTSRQPFNSQLTTVIIVEADKLTEEAQNALLKILEEPPEKSQLILTASSRDSLLPTVKSRLHEVNLGSEIEKERIETKLTSLAEKLNYFDNTSVDELLNENYFQLKEILKTGEKEKIKSKQRFLKLLLKMNKASSLNINKKLISLILSLETS